MNLTEAVAKITRRQLLQATAGAAAGLGTGGFVWAQGGATKEGTVRDRLWLFGIPANINYPYVGRRSLMTPVEGAYYLGVPNILMIQANVGEESKYGRFEPPFDQYAIALRALKRVAWSITGSGGVTSPEYRKDVLELAKRTPNFVGVYMDDFFSDVPKGQVAVLTLDQLRDIRQQLKSSGKKLDIFVTFYTNQLDAPLGDYLRLIDVIAMWTSKPSDLVNLGTNLTKLNKLAPNSRVLLGCYFYDFGARQPVSVAAMKLQCETGLHWLREGRIDGMVFLGNSVEDLGFECVDWTRDWIRKVGDTAI